MAERMRFELTVAFTTPPFQDGALNRSANSPRLPLLFYLFSTESQGQFSLFSQNYDSKGYCLPIPKLFLPKEAFSFFKHSQPLFTQCRFALCLAFYKTDKDLDFLMLKPGLSLETLNSPSSLLGTRCQSDHE